MKKSESRFKKYSQAVLRYFIELLIVFAGVYGAFLLSQYKENRQKAERRDQICDALLREINAISKDAHLSGKGLSQMKAWYDSLMAEKKMPPLIHFADPIAFTPHIWEATIQSDGLVLLKVSMIEEISGFYNSTQKLILLVEQFRLRTEPFLMIDQEKERHEFYDLKTKHLKRKYNWYLNEIGQMAQACSTVAAKGDSLIVFLNREKGDR